MRAHQRGEKRFAEMGYDRNRDAVARQFISGVVVVGQDVAVGKAHQADGFAARQKAGFGLIAFASLFPIISVMAYAQLSAARAKMAKGANKKYE